MTATRFANLDGYQIYKDMFPTLLSNIPLAQPVFITSGSEYNKIYRSIDELINNFTPIGATFSIDYWESLCGIDNSFLPTPIRRLYILAHLNRRFGMPRWKFIDMVALFLDGDRNVDAVEYYNEYVVEVWYSATNSVSLSQLDAFCRSIIPAHLGLKYHTVWDNTTKPVPTNARQTTEYQRIYTKPNDQDKM